MIRNRLITAVALLSIPATTMFAQKVNIPETRRETLRNGLTIILMEYRKIPSVVVRLVVRGGSASDPKEHPGIASMTTSLMREGTVARSSSEIAETIDFVGGSLSVGAGLDYCAATLEVLSKDLEAGLNLLADILMHPSFPPDEIERERGQRRARLDATKEDPSTVASAVFSHQVYGEHPYGIQSEGTRKSIASITRDDLVDFHRRVFVPGNATLVAVGDFGHEEMFRKLIDTFGSWKGAAPPPFLLEKPSPVSGRTSVLVNYPDATQTQIRMGNIGIPINHPDHIPLQVANTIFGGGFTSRLVEELRVKRSLTYGASSWFPASLAGGSYVISTFTKNETVQEAIDVILAELERYRLTGPTDDELLKAQNSIAGDFARGLQTPEAIASQLTDIELFGFANDHLQTYLEQVRSVGMTDLRRVVKTHFVLDDMVLVLVSSPSAVSGITGFGSLRIMTLDEAVK
jgi:zinc protease